MAQAQAPDGAGMTGRYETMFARNRGVFGAFVMLGDPDLETSAAILDELVEGGADMIEVGIPFSDPVADGPVIQAAAVRALAKGVRTADCFALIRGFRDRHPDVPIGILTYANLVLARGRDAFYQSAAAAGADSVLVADVPLLEAEPWAASARAAGIAPVLIAAANTPARAPRPRSPRLARAIPIASLAPGVTGADASVRFDHEAMLTALRDAGAPPPIFGFGISRPEHVRAALDAGAAGVISGSAIVDLVARGEPLVPFIESMKAATYS